MALLLGLVLPGLLRSWERESNRATIREFATTLRTARSEAVTRGVKVRLFLNLKTGRYRVEGSPQEVVKNERVIKAYLGQKESHGYQSH